MTKLQVINTFLTERLMATLNEIMDMIGGTVLQYEKELDSVQKDNEYLRRRLKEIEKLVESNGPAISNPAPSSPPPHLKWTSSIETETMPTEIYQDQNQVQTEQLSSTKVEEFSNHALLVTESDIDIPRLQSPNTLAHTDKDFETSPLNEFPCGVKAEPFESLDSQSTDANTSVYSPLAHCTAQLPATTDINHKSDPKVFSISNSTDLQSAKRMKLKAKTVQVSLSKISQNVLKTSCPVSGVAHVNYNTAHQNTDSRSVRNDTISGNSHLGIANVAVNPLRHASFSSEVRQGMGRGRGRGRVKVPGTHTCPQCGKLFRHHSRLKVHMLIHTGEKPYACAQCGKRFNNDGTLRNHSRVHLRLRLFDCPVCARSFKDAYTCRNHMRVHNR
ncbi:zinc finger protein 32-like [Sinocyclocheilus grahami]|uniref:zinc finger protein 32-like n=1 Tax=Sinocyclocheilus grahami TaxID=75366 RepID=UPI0007AD1E07|nr:PREDICTED: zinc finger protein 32-like [Sinocyclocheilus grahami]